MYADAACYFARPDPVAPELGINASPEDAHQSHFHIYLQPPKLAPITQNLLAEGQSASAADTMTPNEALLQTDAQWLLDYTQTIIDTGEELMFIMDIPYVPMQDTPIVLAQAATPGAGVTPQADYILKDCQETEHTSDPRSAWRFVSPAAMLKNYLVAHDKTGTLNVDLTPIKITLLEGATQGRLTAKTSSSGTVYYTYDPDPSYIGKDKAVFMAEFEGKTYRVVVDLIVKLIVNENSPECPAPEASVRFFGL